MAQMAGASTKEAVVSITSSRCAIYATQAQQNHGSTRLTGTPLVQDSSLGFDVAAMTDVNPVYAGSCGYDLAGSLLAFPT